MTRSLKALATAAVISIAAAIPSYGQVPFCVFFDSVDVSTDSLQTTFDGRPIPVGSVIEAFDPDGISCGKDTVLVEGIYGFMPVIGDDPTTPGLDEGATNGQTISFKINGRPATVVRGDPTWQDQHIKEVALAANSVNIAIAGVHYPPDTTVGFNYTVRFHVGVRNDGDGLDFYGVTASSQKGWNITAQPNFVYADPNDTAFIYFDLDIPLWFPGGDTTDLVTYSVFSYLDPSQHVDSTVRVYSSITDGIGDGNDGLLPSGYVLEQNYPNPFNPTTNISFQLPVKSSVRLEFYDILGRQVETADMGSLSAGQHVYEFNGMGKASGVYFYRLVTEQFIDTKKMLLVK